MSFGEKVSPVAAIQAILHDYPFCASILRELLQNSDDAGAIKQIFVLDKGVQPALMAYNDSEFQEADWEGIQSIHESSKKADASKIGKYGVGFRACYHITDQPQILSGSSFAVLDPLHSNSIKIEYNEFKTKEYFKDFDFFSSMFNPNSFIGTAIRLPLRSTQSELSQRVVLAAELQKMIADYISEELNVSLLFLDKLKTIEIWETSNGAKMHLATWTRSGTTPSRQDPSVPLVTYNTVLSDGNAEYSWRIVQTQNSEGEATSRLSHLAGNGPNGLVNFIVQKHKLRSDVRIAYPLTSQKGVSGRLFTFLPLPSKTAFPIHIHALFALTSSRQSLRNANETGIVKGSDNDILIKWNRLLFNHYIPQGWGYLLKTLAEEASCSDIFSVWPPYCSSITSGDGIYWQDILPRTFRIVVESGLKVWPKVSSEGSTTYVDLKSSLIVAQGQVDADVLAVLAALGLTLVQLPQRLLKLVDNSMTKLSPSVVHGKLQDVLDRFDQLSLDQRGLVCKYLLSDSDISKIFGLPLIPVLNGSFVALDHRNKSLQRFIALTKSEVAVFGTSACDAIPLDQLGLRMARLLREQGINRANVDLLGPRHVLDYLSNEKQILSNEWLTEFWCWVGDWHLKEELVGLLKDNKVLRLIPTTKGPQLVPSLVFNVMQNADKLNVQLFGKLGLAFIISVLPLSVVGLLFKCANLKSASDLNHFVTAINLDPIPYLTDNEAKMIFDHITAYHGPVSPDALTKLRKLPIFPVMVPAEEPGPHLSSNSSVSWRGIHEITIKGISAFKLIPIADDTHFLSKSNIRFTTCSVLKKLHIPVLKDEDILMCSLELFASQPKPLQVAFVSYIRLNQSCLPKAQQALQKTAFLLAADGSLQSPEHVIDPESPLAKLFPQGCKDSRIPVNGDEYDNRLFDDFRALCLTKATLEADLVQERISYISSNSSSPEAITVAFSLLELMNKPTFSCHGLHIDPNMSWLPTAKGLTTSKQCINGGQHNTDLFDEVLVTLDKAISISPSFKGLLDWDKLLPLEVLVAQLLRVLESSLLDVKSPKIRNIIKELSNRQISDADLQVIRTAVDGRAWIPTKSGQLAQPSRVVFVNVEDSSGFHEAAFSKIDKEIYQFLCSMGCLERPTAAVIIEELKALQEKSKEDGSVVQPAIVLLEMLPGFMTKEEFASLLVPDESGHLVPLSSGICYYSGSGGVDANNAILIAHHLVTERLAEKLRMSRLGLEAEDDIDLGGKPITTIRNALEQSAPQQFFTEFIANASDAKAKQFSLLIDDHEGPTDPKKLFSAGMAVLQSASLVVYNDGVFDTNDFKGIRDTGTGGKRERSDVIGYFGLGALSMFHFTELAMIVSAGHVLFLNPAKHSLGYRNRNSVLLPLHHVKRLYRGHLEPLDGLFGFNLNSTEFYQGTIFRLPLRQLHFTNAVSLSLWSTKTVKGMLLEQFDNLAYKSLLFTGLARIELCARRDSQLKTLRSIEVTRQPDNSITGVPFGSEIVTFTRINVQTKWLVLSKPAKIPELFGKALQGRSNILPVKVAAALDDARTPNTKRNLFCALPLPVTTSLPVHISAPFILERQRRNIRLDDLGMESKYNRWLLSSEIPSLYLYLLETLLSTDSTQGTNKAWWPPTSQNGGNSMATQIFIDAFWTREILATSPRRIFASRTKPSTHLAPQNAILLDETHSFNKTLSKIVDVSQPASVVDFSGTPTDAAAACKAGLRFVDAPFVKNLLQGFQVCQQLDEDDIKMALLFLCSNNRPVPLGLPLLPLEDGSYGTISLKSNSRRTYYVLDRASSADYPPFRKDHFIHREFKTFLLNSGYKRVWDRLHHENNVSPLTPEGIVKLMKDFIEPADEFVGDHAYENWVNDFWRAEITKPQAVSQFPLVSTCKRLHYISFRKVNDSSVIVLEDKPPEQPHYSVLQKLGLTIVARETLPSHLRADVKTKFSVYTSFLKFIREHPDKLRMMRQLTTDDQEVLGSWIRSCFPYSTNEYVHVACQVPVWPVQQGPNNTWLGALDDAAVTILPHRMPVAALCPFTNYAIMNWEESMKNVKEPCTTQRIVELLRVSAGTVIRQAVDRDNYEEFIKNFVTMDKVGDHQLLVPNSNFTLQYASNLFEPAELFVATFKSDSPLLLSQNFQHFAEDLEKYGLKLQSCLDLPMFIECAAAFDSDTDSNRNKEPRGVVLYRYFNSLRLSPEDTQRCRELDDFKFIPRIDRQRPGYGDVDTIGYMDEDLPRVLLAPAQITIPDFEAICWSQKGRTNPSPNKTLCGTYQSLGKPNGSDVLAHLLVLAEISRVHGSRKGLLSDLKATYRWLNDHADDIAALIKPRRNDKLFLNVDDPESDKWIWDSASKLVIGLQDVGEIREVKGSLRNYSELLDAAGVRKVQKGPAKPIPAREYTSLDLRGQFNNMRKTEFDTNAVFVAQDCHNRNYSELLNAADVGRVQKGPAEPIPAREDTLLALRGQFNNMRKTEFDTNVVFVAKDYHNRILPAHRNWLAANNNHFRTVFLGSGMRELQALESTESVITVERSSMCVKGVVDWFYVGKLPDSLTSGNSEEVKQRLILALEMLSLSKKWQVTDLHRHLQLFIINDPQFVNPCWLGSIRKHAKASTAIELLEYCEKYEEANPSLIDDFGSSGNGAE
ncbi:hypothetical protein JOM56_004732 [Amanita muscaria]